MERKQLIIEHAIELFAEKGINATSIQEITDQCRISKGAFYLSFKSKDELVLSIIDHVMKLITTDIDQVVSKEQNPQTKLYEFYLMTFKSFKNNAKFAKVFLKEQLHFINEAFIEKLNYYDHLSNEALFQLLEELYGDKIAATKFDLLITIKGFLHAYSQLLFSEEMNFDLQLLSKTLVEKTNIIAKHTKLSFLTENPFKLVRHQPITEVTLPQIITEIERLIEWTKDPIKHESLLILKVQLQSKNPSQAIILGLLQNLNNNERYRWLIYMLKRKYARNAP